VDLSAPPDLTPANAESPPPPPQRSRQTALVIALGVVVVVAAIAISIIATSGGSGDKPAVESTRPPATAPPAAGALPTTAEAPAGPGATAVPAGGYSVSDDFCRSVDFAPVAALYGRAVKAPAMSKADKAGFSTSTCSGSFAKKGVPVTSDVKAMIFNTSADASYATAKKYAPAQPVDEIKLAGGAFGYLTTGDGARVYQLWVLDKNLQLGVAIKATPATPPTRDQLRDAAIKVAVTTLGKLPHA
jgi:hypothetical protein